MNVPRHLAARAQACAIQMQRLVPSDMNHHIDDRERNDMQRKTHQTVLPSASPSPAPGDIRVCRPDSPESVEIRNGHIAASLKSMDPSERRLIALALRSTGLSIPDPRTMPLNAGWKVKISAREYAKYFDVLPTSSYEEMSGACDKLFKRSVAYETEIDGRTAQKRFRWISAVSSAKGAGYIEINFTPEVALHLLHFALATATLGGIKATHAFEDLAGQSLRPAAN